MGCCAGKTSSTDKGDSAATAPAAHNQQQLDAGFTANNGGAAVLPGAPGGAMSFVPSASVPPGRGETNTWSY